MQENQTGLMASRNKPLLNLHGIRNESTNNSFNLIDIKSADIVSNETSPRLSGLRDRSKYRYQPTELHDIEAKLENLQQAKLASSSLSNQNVHIPRLRMC